jgi:hypothetical protein
MGILSILLGNEKGSTIAMIDDAQIEIRDLPVDLVSSEAHQISVAVSEHPLETGASIADHIRRLPDQCSIEGLFSDTPISLFDAGRRFLDGEPHTVRALTFFEELANEKRLCNFQNRFKAYRNMVCTGITFTRQGRQGDSVRFSCTFRQILFAQSQTIAASQVEGINSSTRQQGRLAPSTPTPETQAATGSLLARLFGIGG